MMRVKLRWSGFQGGPGYSIFHFQDSTLGVPSVDDVNIATGKVAAFADAIKGMVPNGTSLAVESDVEVIDVVTGQMEDIVSGAPVAAVASTASPAYRYAAAAGAVITWRTAGVRNGRRVRGRTFMVPLHSEVFATDGTLDNGFVTGIGTAAAALRTASNNVRLGVYARPNPVTAAGGDFFEVVSHSVPDRSAILKSRRD